MSFDDPRAYGDRSLFPLDSADRETLTRLLSLVVEADRPDPAVTPGRGSRAELAKSLYDQRRRREGFLPADLFGEPAWDILLVLYWARHSQHRMSVSAVCASAAAPSTTALRYIEHLCRCGLIVRRPHPTDRRVSWLSISDDADQKVGDYLDRISS
jgi:DNA-binding MarR family transcriptional regulator